MASEKINVAYCRFSSEAQRDSTSISVQIEQCQKAAGQKLATYIDEARTGRAVAGRENLHRLLIDAANGKITKVYVARYDRLGRNEADTFATIEELESYGCEVLSASESKDAVSRGLMVVLAAHYSRDLAIKTRNGLIKTHELRTHVGGRAAYGYQIVERDRSKVLAIEPNEAGVVQAIFNAYLGEQPMGYKAIAKMLNDRAIPTRSMVLERDGKGQINRKINRVRLATPWAMTSIRAILLNELYTGKVTYNKRNMKLDRTTGRRVPRFNDQSQVMSYQDENLRIIADEQFQAAVVKLAARATGEREARDANQIRAFTGHLFCEHCGSAFYSRKSQNAKGTYIYYNCGCRQRRGPEACPNGSMVREDLLLSSLQQVCIITFADIDGMVEGAVAEARSAADSNRQDAERLRAELAALDVEIGNFTRLLKDPTVVAEPMAFKQLLRQSATLEGKREALKSSLDRLLDKANDDTGRLADRMRRRMIEARDRWEAVNSPAQLNRLIEEFVGPRIVTREGRLVPPVMVGPETQPAPDGSGAGVRGFIAGGRNEPYRITPQSVVQTAFFAELARVAV